MSLIQDALKKAQEQREMGRETGYDAGEVPGRVNEPFFSTKRKLFYGLLFLVVVIAVVVVTVVLKPPAVSSMKPLHGSSQAMPVKADVSPTPSEEPKESGETKETSKPESPVASTSVTLPAQEQKPEVVKKEEPRIKARLRPGSGAPKKQKKEKETATRQTVLEKLIGEGDQLAGRGDFVLAVDRYKKALNAEKRVSVYLKLYSTFRAMKNDVLARAYVEDGLKYFPDSFALNKVAAIVYIRAGEFEKALERVETALAQKANDYMLLTYKGLCLFHKKEYEAALLSFKGSLDLNADAVENYYYIGLIYDNVKNYHKALEFYRVFLSLNPEDEHFKHRDWVINRIRTLEKHLNVK